MNQAIYRAGITIASCVTCSAVTYAARADVGVVFLFTGLLTALFFGLVMAKETS